MLNCTKREKELILGAKILLRSNLGWIFAKSCKAVLCSVLRVHEVSKGSVIKQDFFLCRKQEKEKFSFQI